MTNALKLYLLQHFLICYCEDAMCMLELIDVFHVFVVIICLFTTKCQSFKVVQNMDQSVHKDDICYPKLFFFFVMKNLVGAE